jgi:hypothetical protein
MYQKIVRDEWQRFCNSTVVLDTRWRAFLNREHMNAAPDDLNQILEDLRRFLVPLAAPPSNKSRWPAGGPWSASA